MKRPGIRPGTISWTLKEWQAFLDAARDIPFQRGDSPQTWAAAQVKAGLPPERVRGFEANGAVVMNAYRKGGIEMLMREGIPNGAIPQHIQMLMFGKICTRPKGVRADAFAAADRFSRPVRPSIKAPSVPVILRPTPEPAPAVVETPPTPQPKVELPTPVVEPINGASVVSTPTLDHLSKLAADAISDVVLRVLYNPEIRSALRNIVLETLAPEAELEQDNSIVWRAPKVGREVLPRIVLVGGWTHTIEVVRRIKNVDWRFYGRGVGQESLHRLRGLASGADLAVIMTKNCGHPAEQSAKSRAKDFIRWSGNDEGLIAEVNAWLAQWRSLRETA